MSLTYNQSDVSAGAILVSDKNYIMSAGATLGTLSISGLILSSGFATTPLNFATTTNDPGTTTWEGSCVFRWNITTSNANATWYGIDWYNTSASSVASIITSTSSLAIGLGTTGVKTASVGDLAALSVNTASGLALRTLVSSGATMNTTLRWINNQTVTVLASSAAPAPSANIPSIALLNSGF